MTYHRSRSRNLPTSPSMATLQFKLARIVSRQDQLKLSFNHLKSQIKLGLLEAEDVFNSLAVPLMKLVGLKSAEMAEEGRSNTIFMKISLHDQGYCEDSFRVDKQKSLSIAAREYNNHRLEEDCTNSAIMAGKEILQKQKLQLIQLLQLLKQVESCVNSSQNSMYQTIDDHKDCIHTFVHKAFTYVSIIQQSNHDGSGAFNITLKLLKTMYDHICAVLSSVEGEVDNLVNKLTEQMCKPMIEYVKNFKDEMTAGTCPRLLVALEDMRGAARDGRVELEQARNKVIEAEERKLEAMSMLKESEERIKKMRQYLDFIDDKKESTGHYGRNKGDQTKDDKLLWELLKKKRTCQQPESPIGPEVLLPVGTGTKHHRLTMGKPSNISRPTTRSYTRSKKQSLDSLLQLGSSPSVTTKQALSRKHVPR